jgi:uncharacterized protein YbbC (DUF1343 family)
MNKLTLSLCSLALAGSAAAQVLTGVEVLRSEGFAPLQAKRIGLITNPTGVDSRLVSTIDILNDAPQVKLTTLFAPEHGVRGDVVAGGTVSNQTDSKTGLPVKSLYGRTKKPTAEMLSNVDALVYDIQDIGCRSYTFISTLGRCMEACREQGKEMIVLDRPNPLGGNRVEGPLVDDECISFVSQYKIPYIYGMTPGELARWLNSNVFNDGVSLTVVKMQGWTRSMTFEQTGLPWVATSPNIPTAATTLMYPATGIMGELPYVTIGANYTMPFRVAVASWVNADSLAMRCNALQLPGVMFRPVHMKPKDTNLHGVEIYVNSDETEQLTLIQFYILQELAAMYPARKPFDGATATQLSMFDRVCGSRQIRQRFSRRYRVEDILELWQTPETFTPIHLYE